MAQFKNIIQRIYNYSSKAAAAVVKLPEPELLEGVGALKKLPEAIKNQDVHKLFIVSGKHTRSSKEYLDFIEGLKDTGLEYFEFCGVSPNPTVQIVNKAKEQFKENNCDSVVAFGGGSSIDCAKIVAALAIDPRNTHETIRGYFKIKGKVAPIFAVPTTSGTGSETSICAVVTDSEKGDKYSASDFKLVPKVAVLDPTLTATLPPQLTAETGMDALTHAIEAYIGVGGTKYTDEMAKKAVKLIFENLLKAYKNGSDLEARRNMALASFYAGCAFTRAYVGNVHSLAHSLGGFYNTPHGFANAVILPYVLDFYGKKAQDKLGMLAEIVGLSKTGERDSVLAPRFIEKIREMNKEMGIPDKIDGIKKEDIPALSRHALKEANPHYPVPVIMTEKDCEEIYKKLM